MEEKNRRGKRKEGKGKYGRGQKRIMRGKTREECRIELRKLRGQRKINMSNGCGRKGRESKEDDNKRRKYLKKKRRD